MHFKKSKIKSFLIFCLFNLFSSARSKVKGFLELYHAYLRLSDHESNLEVSRHRNSADPDSWEIVDASTESIVETPAQVIIKSKRKI